MTAAPRLALVAAVAVAAAGCGVADDRDRVRDSASEFYAALAARDGAAACDRLTPPASDALEQIGRRRCERAILDLDLGAGPVREVAVFETEAVVALPGGERAYLDRRAGGWKVTAAGCKLLPAGPADCELEE